MNQSLKELTTSCVDCIFRRDDNDKNQVGCYIQNTDNLDTFVEYKQDKSHLVIKGLCQYKREAKWQGNKTFIDALVDVREEVKINYAAITEPSQDLELIKKTVSSLDKQAHPPATIYIFRYLMTL
jgi:hypothetical protein